MRLPFALIAASISALALAQPAASAVQKQEYAVIRGGEQIGRHVIEIDRQGEKTAVRLSTHVAVKVAFITVYHFDQSSSETWAGNHLVSLQSTTDDNGDKHQLSVSGDGNALRVEADGKRRMADKALLPASLWSASIVKQSSLLNTVKGSLMNVRIAEIGEEAIPRHSSKLSARHFRMTGDLERDLWYDAAGTLVRLQMKGSDGSLVVYELR
ncbi:MAG: hypothetical protein JSS20_14835 [Proteobacteria bacterium]|nr:hypothetical protein [Pseudomonadota bacterium]